MTPEEEFHNCFSCFLDALKAATSDKNNQIKRMGGYAATASWEIQHDILDFAFALKYWFAEYPFLIKYLSKSELIVIDEIIRLFQEMPKDSVAGYSAADLDHPAWEKVRTEASNLALKLCDAEKKNHNFLYKHGN